MTTRSKFPSARSGDDGTPDLALGSQPGEAFYVKCDAETNPPEVRDAGRVVTEIGLRPVGLVETIVLRLVQDESGLRVGTREPQGMEDAVENEP